MAVLVILGHRYRLLRFLTNDESSIERSKLLRNNILLRHHLASIRSKKYSSKYHQQRQICRTELVPNIWINGWNSPNKWNKNDPNHNDIAQNYKYKVTDFCVTYQYDYVESVTDLCDHHYDACDLRLLEKSCKGYNDDSS